MDKIKAPHKLSRVLLVDDEPVVRRLTAKMLERLGCVVSEAGDGLEALALLESAGTANIDLLISDIQMPRMDGNALAAAVHERWPDLRMLLTSGFADTVPPFCDLSTQFLRKPYNLKNLREKTDRLLGRDAEAVEAAETAGA